MSKKDNVLVTGASGLVGSAVVRSLKRNGYENIFTPSHTELNLLSEDDFSDYCYLIRPRIVICCAARVGGIGGNSKDNYGFLWHNLKINQNTISGSFINGVPKLVFLGSSCIYPKMATQPIDETELLNGYLEPTNEGYALSKITGIKMCEYIRRQNSDRCYYSLMPCNLYGPGDNYNVKNGHVLPTLIRKFIEAKENNYPEVYLWGDGTPLREFLYSDDLADVVVKTLDVDNGKIPNLMNVGSGVEYSISQLANIIKDKVGYTGTIVWDTTKPNGTPRKIMNSSLLKKHIDWEPQINLERGIELCIEDYLNNRSTLRN